jgi:hypothetical protein
MKASQSAKDTYVTWWHIAQLMFPLMLVVAIMSRSVFGLPRVPFMVFGLYKFGFPEIVSYLAEAKAKHTQFCYDKNKSQEGPVPLTVRQVVVWHLHLLHPRVLGPFMDGLGLHLHHMAASYVICSMATHLFPLKRQLVAPCIVCVIQHWFVLLKYLYHSSTCYILVELGLELWFEWEVLHGEGRLWQGGACGGAYDACRALDVPRGGCAVADHRRIFPRARAPYRYLYPHRPTVKGNTSRFSIMRMANTAWLRTGATDDADLDDGEMKENPLNAGAAGGSGGGEGASHTGEEQANDLKMFNTQHGHGHGKAGVHAHGHHSHFGDGHKKKEVELVPKGSVANMAQAQADV